MSQGLSYVLEIDFGWESEEVLSCTSQVVHYDLKKRSKTNFLSHFLNKLARNFQSEGGRTGFLEGFFSPNPGGRTEKWP